MNIPPLYVVAPAALVYGELPRPVAMTGLRIWGLGWRYRYEKAGPVSEEELLSVVRVGRSQLYQHLGRLVATGVLRYSSTGGKFTFWFNKAARFARAGPVSPENRTGIVVVDSSLSERHVPLSSEGEGQQQHHFPNHGGECEGGAGQSGKSDWEERLKVLDRFGILEPVRSEIAALAWAGVGYLEGWWEWYQAEAECELGAGFFVTQFRAGAVARAVRGRKRYLTDGVQW